MAECGVLLLLLLLVVVVVVMQVLFTHSLRSLNLVTAPAGDCSQTKLSFFFPPPPFRMHCTKSLFSYFSSWPATITTASKQMLVICVVLYNSIPRYSFRGCFTVLQTFIRGLQSYVRVRGKRSTTLTLEEKSDSTTTVD